MEDPNSPTHCRHLNYCIQLDAVCVLSLIDSTAISIGCVRATLAVYPKAASRWQKITGERDRREDMQGTSSYDLFALALERVAAAGRPHAIGIGIRDFKPPLRQYRGKLHARQASDSGTTHTGAWSPCGFSVACANAKIEQ